MVHQGNLVLSHHPLGIVAVIGITLGLAAIAIATQIGSHNGEMGCQTRCDFVPHTVRLWITMQQQQCRAVPTNDGLNGDLPNRDLFTTKAREHRPTPFQQSLRCSQLSASRVSRLPQTLQPTGGSTASPSTAVVRS